MSRVRRGARRLLAAATALLVAGGCRLQRVPPGPPEDVIASGPFAGMLVVRLRNGSNDVDLDGDGGLDLVFSAWRENYNAHSYATTTFYWQKRDSTSGPRWQLVPFFDAKGVQSDDRLATSQGADCVLADLRLLRPGASGGRNSLVVAASRDVGRSYADTAPVTFTVYTLERNDQGLAGSPARRFQLTQTFRSRARYCDVGNAFARELGIPRDTLSEQ